VSIISQPPSPAKKHLKLASKMSAPKKAKTTRRGAAVIGQSGGPTVVINQSLVGFVKEALKHEEITKVFGMRHGIQVRAPFSPAPVLPHPALPPACSLNAAPTPRAGRLVCWWAGVGRVCWRSTSSTWARSPWRTSTRWPRPRRRRWDPCA
jgi:hypothetical protein